MRFTITLSLFFCFLSAFAQVNYTANDQIPNYDGGFRAGVNPGYHGSNWGSLTLSDIAAGNPAAGVNGVGVRAIRGSLPEGIALQYEYSTWKAIYDYYDALGLEDNNMFVGFASDQHRDPIEYCPGVPTDMFANLYEPIWDGGANGTPVNENNYYALYLYNVVTTLTDKVRFWEIWNEPGFDFTGAKGWLAPGQAGNWWENYPEPCDYKLRAPVFHYIRTLRISYEIIKTLSPEDFVVVAGVGYNSFLDVILRTTDNPNGGTITNDYPLRGGAYFDILGFHAYPHIDGSIRYWDNNIGGFVYRRHSDGALEGLIETQQERRTILEQYGYDGVTYPRKLWTSTEINVPRKGFNGSNFGSDELQVNYISKLIVTAMQNGILQTHIWDMAEKVDLSAATNEFDLMGLYKNISEVEPFEQSVNDEGISYKTTSDFLFEKTYDATKTASMNLPSNIGGGAFQKSNGDHVYVLWAKTLTDNSENANAAYSFPASFGISSLERRNWDYSQTLSTSTISQQNVTLTGTPIFLTPNINQPTGILTINCPGGNLIEEGALLQAGGKVVTWQLPSATTTCPSGGATVTQLSGPPSGSLFPFGATVIKYLATDTLI